MLFSKREASLRHLLLLIYALVVILFVFLVVREKQEGTPPFSVSRVAVTSKQESAVVSIYGEGLHSGIKILSVRSLLNEDALFWTRLEGARTKSIDVDKNIALVACFGKRLVSLLLDGDRPPTMLGSIEFDSVIRKILIVGDRALVSMSRHEGLSLVDLHDPKSLQLIGHYPVPGFVTDMVADRDMVYFTDLHRGLGRINLAAENPVPEVIVPMESPWRVDRQGGRLAVATAKGKVKLFNLAEDGQLLEAGSFDNQVNVPGITFAEDSLTIVLADNTLRVFNLSSWPQLENPAILKLPGRPLVLDKMPGQAILAVSLVAGGLAMVDVSNPEVPVLSGRLMMPKTFWGMTLQPEGLLAAGRDGLEMYSLDKIAKWKDASLLKEAVVDQENYTLVSWNQQVYGQDSGRLVYFGKKSLSEAHSSTRFMAIIEEGAVSLLEPDGDGQMRRVGSLPLSEKALDLILQGESLYVLHHSGLLILSGSRSDELLVTGELLLAGTPTHMAITDSGYLLVATRDEGVLVVDVNDPHKPGLIASIVQPKHLQSINVVFDILVAGQQAYLSMAKGGVYVYDISTPSLPKLIQILPTPEPARWMDLHDNLLLVAVGPKGLFLIDIEDGAMAKPVGLLATPLRVRQMAVLDDGLLTSSHPGGTVRLPLPERIDAAESTSSEMKIRLEKVGQGQYLYLYDGNGSQQVRVGM